MTKEFFTQKITPFCCAQPSCSLAPNIWKKRQSASDTHLLGLKLPECRWLWTVCHLPDLLVPAPMQLSLRLGPPTAPPPTSPFSSDPLKEGRESSGELEEEGKIQAQTVQKPSGCRAVRSSEEQLKPSRCDGPVKSAGRTSRYTGLIYWEHGRTASGRQMLLELLHPICLLWHTPKKSDIDV